MVTLAGKQAAASPLCRLVRRSTIQHFFVISFQLKTFLQEEPRGRFCKIFRSVIIQSELCHNSKDDPFAICEKVVTELWLSYDWPKIFKEPASVP
jgi:hypothetical protein